jgi:hypothetical protein
MDWAYNLCNEPGRDGIPIQACADDVQHHGGCAAAAVGHVGQSQQNAGRVPYIMSGLCRRCICAPAGAGIGKLKSDALYFVFLSLTAGIIVYFRAPGRRFLRLHHAGAAQRLSHTALNYVLCGFAARGLARC